MKNLKVNKPLVLAIILAVTLVSCKHDAARREHEQRENVRNTIGTIDPVKVEDIITPPEEMIENETHKTR